MPDIPVLLVQIGAILLAARLTGKLFRRFGQPQVVGEMAAGILLGPSFLGWLSPAVSAYLFPAASLGFLYALCQVGLVLFMFLVGVDLDPQFLRDRGHVAIVTSHASILAPFFLGTLLALALYPKFSSPAVPFASFALFLGTAMSVTAFPVLARILQERGLQHGPVGTVALACAAVDDVSAWCILAGVILVARAQPGASGLPRMLAGTVLFIVAMLTVGRLAFRRLEKIFQKRERLSRDALAIILLCVLASAWVAEWIGIHALFGAFLAGAMMPRDRALAEALTQRLEDFAVVVLLPLFFAFTGLRTSVGLLSGTSLWIGAGSIFLVAVAGKLGGSALAARFCGMSWREAAGVGVLMNTRGLMELVVLNIGLDIGVISPSVFTMLVLMALATTLMTSPLLSRIYPAPDQIRFHDAGPSPQ
jgi:Kef-type K+ transport system membrane component KefB